MSIAYYDQHGGLFFSGSVDALTAHGLEIADLRSEADVRPGKAEEY
jgi:hypothetical protein